MERLSLGSVLRAYLKKLRFVLFTDVLFALLLLIVFVLYLENWGAVAYGLLLCSALGALFLGLGFIRFYSRHRQLEAQQERILYELGGLPEADDLLCEDYQALLWTLHGALARERSAAARSSAALTDYYSLWTHQIKTPIAAMDLLLQAGEADAQMLRAELFRIEQYVGMALSYARLEDASSDMRFGKVCVENLVRQATREYAQMFILRHIRLELQAFSCTVLSDEKWLLFIVEQLLSNAAKYTPPGGKVTMLLEAPQTLVIRDTGIGIAADDLPRIFERGYTGYHGRQYEKSTGLGLYLCKRTADRLGHKIELSSELSVGTTVRLDLSREARGIE